MERKKYSSITIKDWNDHTSNQNWLGLPIDYCLPIWIRTHLSLSLLNWHLTFDDTLRVSHVYWMILIHIKMMVINLCKKMYYIMKWDLDSNWWLSKGCAIVSVVGSKAVFDNNSLITSCVKVKNVSDQENQLYLNIPTFYRVVMT